MQPTGPFILLIRDLEEGENHLELVGTGADLSLPPQEMELEGPVQVRALVFRAGQKVEVQGSLNASARLVCDRCLDPVRYALHAGLRVYAERQESRDRRSRQEVREEDQGIVYHDGQFVDLTDEIRQTLLVELPWHIVCKEDCRGLCPRCGVNRNWRRCDCLTRGGKTDEPSPEQGSSNEGSGVDPAR